MHLEMMKIAILTNLPVVGRCKESGTQDAKKSLVLDLYSNPDLEVSRYLQR